MRVIGCGLAAIMFALAAAPTFAQSEEEVWNRCLQQDAGHPPSPEVVIAACRLVLGMDIYPNQSADAFNNIGVAYMRMDKYDEAIRSFGEALRKLRELPEIWEVRQLANYSRRNRGHAYIATKQYDKALDDFDAAAATEPKAEYLALRCWAHALYDDKFTNALPDCQKAVDSAPQKAGDAYAAFLIVQYRQGKYQDVKSDCKLVGTKAFLTPDALYCCGRAEQRVGDASFGHDMLKLARIKGERVSERFKELGIE